MKSDYIYSKPTWSLEDPKETIVKEVRSNSNVLDVGCGVGAFGQWLIKNRKCKVSGLEFHPSAVKEAKKRLTDVKQVDLNDIDQLKKVLGSNRYDYITLIDVLEHCLHPVEVLKTLGGNLNKSGEILISLPNVAHYSVRLSLLMGRFEYADSGILDKTHVKFYTRNSMELLIRESGLSPKVLGSTIPRSGIKSLLGKVDPSLFAVQFIFRASR